MIDNGYIKLHRSILGWEWVDDLNTLRLWIHLLCTVCWEPSSYKGMELKPGQRIASLTQLAKEIKAMSIRQIRTAKQHLLDTGEVTVSDTPFGDLITIENWAKYQVREIRTDTASDTGADSQTTRDMTGDRHESEEEEEIKNNINSARTPVHTRPHIEEKIEDMDLDFSTGHIVGNVWRPNKRAETPEERRENYYKYIACIRGAGGDNAKEL